MIETVVLAIALCLGAPDAKLEAAAAFTRATEAYERGDFETALDQFKHAQQLSPHDRVRFNVALTFGELGRYAEAVVIFKDIVGSSELTDAQRIRAREQLADYRTKLGTLLVHAEPSERVVIDTDVECDSPCEVELEPGPHVVELPRRAGDTRRDVEIAAGGVVELRFERTAPPPPVITDPAPVGAPEQPPRRHDEPAKPRPSALLWTGVAVGSLGIAGTIGFGVAAQRRHDDYEREPLEDTRKRGVLMRNLANASIGFAALGGALIVADLIRLGVLKRRASRIRAASR